MHQRRSVRSLLRSRIALVLCPRSVQTLSSIPEETKYPAMSRASFLTSMPFLAALGTTLSFFAFTGNDYLAHLLRIGVYLRQHHDYTTQTTNQEDAVD